MAVFTSFLISLEMRYVLLNSTDVYEHIKVFFCTDKITKISFFSRMKIKKCILNKSITRSVCVQDS